MFFALLYSELMKLMRSMGFLVIVVTPALPGLLVFLAVVSSDREASWQSMLQDFAWPIWTLFLLPLAISGFSALAGQVEHRDRGWDQLLTLPVRRPAMFATKLLVGLAAVPVMTVLMIFTVLAAAFLGSSVGAGTMTGAVDVGAVLELAVKTSASALAIAAIQFWVSHRFSNFVAAVSVGSAGTLVIIASAMTGLMHGQWFPWLYPYRTYTGTGDLDPIAASLAVTAVVSFLAVMDLSRKEYR